MAAFVAKHFRENVDPLGYKAFLVAVHLEACALYEEALDEHLPAEYSVPVYTRNATDWIERPKVADLMRDHVLLQAVARVNRPFEDEKGRNKPCGLIIDFVGVLRELKKALAPMAMVASWRERRPTGAGERSDGVANRMGCTRGWRYTEGGR